MPNVALLKKTLAHIENHTTAWNQLDWTGHNECGTTYCFAGWAAVLSGTRPDDDDEVRRDDLPADIADVEYEHWPAAKGFLHVADAARHLLGLTKEQADELFHEYNKLPDLRRIVAELCGETATAGTP